MPSSLLFVQNKLA